MLLLDLDSSLHDDFILFFRDNHYLDNIEVHLQEII